MCICPGAVAGANTHWQGLLLTDTSGSRLYTGNKFAQSQGCSMYLYILAMHRVLVRLPHCPPAAGNACQGRGRQASGAAQQQLEAAAEPGNCSYPRQGATHWTAAPAGICSSKPCRSTVASGEH